MSTSVAWLSALIGLAVALTAISTLAIHPHYLAHFNQVSGGPDRDPPRLIDSNLDWGQGLLALRDYQAQHPNEPIYLDYFGTIDPKIYGIRYTQLQPNQRVTGTVVVSATNLSGQLLDDPNGYHWLLQYPATILDHSLYVFQVPPDAK